MRNKLLGKLGELITKKVLTSQNYEILMGNYRCRYGEIDIILLKNHKLIFVEVKTRTNNTFGEINETLTSIKKKRLLKTIHWFFLKNAVFRNLNWQLDLIAVKFDLKNLKKEIHHFKNILDE